MADEVDRLYALPLDEFTRARNELAKEAKDPAIRSLRKPSVSAWAVNQLARRREVDVRRLLRAAEALEQAQRDALGGGDQGAFERARRDEREAVRRLRAAAAELLRDAGHPASDATLERVAKTLHAAAASADGREQLRAGRLTDDLEPQGFDALAGMTPAGPRGKRASRRPAGPTAAERRRAKAARAELEEARREAAAAADRLREAERALRLAEREVEQARAAADRAATKADRLEARAKEFAD
jgi:hypothetical protein